MKAQVLRRTGPSCSPQLARSFRWRCDRSERGGTVSLAGIHVSATPEMDYETCLYHEKQLRSMESNTREDGRQLLVEAARIPIRPKITTFPLERAGEALIALEESRIDGTGVLMVGG